MILSESAAYRTPHRLDRLVLTPSYTEGAFDSLTVDSPFVFRHDDGRWGMTYVGWDGEGYQTGLAWSDDLVTWRKHGLILGRKPNDPVMRHNAALTAILRHNDLYGPGTLKKVNGRYIGTWHAYPAAGLEAGPAVIGLCTSADLLTWEVLPPILRPEDGAPWERGGLYKSWLTEHDGTYYLFYNAKDRDQWPWREQTGVATSRDLVNWTRHAGNPILRNGGPGSMDERFASDPCVLRDDGRWIMGYFGFAEDDHTRETIAFSDDLLSWRQPREVLIDVGGAGAIDEQHAHKPSLVGHGGVLYHFYCAAANRQMPPVGKMRHNEVRGVALATSAPV